MPITSTIYRVLYEGQDIKEAINELMGRPVSQEGK